MRFCLGLIAILVLLAGGCTRGERAQVPVEHQPYTHLRFDDDPGKIQFAIVGDRTGRHRPGVFEKGIAKLNLLRPQFVMSVGDLIEGYTKDEAEIDQQWDEIQGFTSKLDAPFFYVPGNHDLANPIQAKKWRERFGRSYYHFVYRNVLFLAVNTYDPEQKISPEQIASIAKALKENPSVRWTCVFMHEPLWDYKQPTGWAEVEDLLKNRPYTVFAGHYHTYTKYIRHDRKYIVLATTGGGMKDGLTGPELGSFDHVTWVTMMPDGPRLANIELDGIHDEDVRTEAMANLINRVLRGEVMEVSPVLAKGDTFRRADVTLTVKNDSDVPMTASGAIPAVGPLRAVPDRFEVSVPAKGQATIRAELRAEPASAPVAELAPMSVKWTATYLAPGRNPVRVPRVDRIAVERIAGCPARTAPVVVDGKLDEWTRFPFSGAAKDPKDLSYDFAVEHDDNFVYIAVKTTDDASVLNSNKEPWSQDGIEVRFDARPEPLRSQGRGRGEFKDIVVISASPADNTGGGMVLYSAKDLPPGVKAVCVKTPTGIAEEIAIPVSYLNERQGGAWSGFRMNLTVDDFDTIAGPLEAHWWRPDWRCPDTFAGSGTFERK